MVNAMLSKLLLLVMFAVNIGCGVWLIWEWQRRAEAWLDDKRYGPPSGTLPPDGFQRTDEWRATRRLRTRYLVIDDAGETITVTTEGSAYGVQLLGWMGVIWWSLFLLVARSPADQFGGRPGIEAAPWVTFFMWLVVGGGLGGMMFVAAVDSWLRARPVVYRFDREGVAIRSRLARGGLLRIPAEAGVEFVPGEAGVWGHTISAVTGAWIVKVAESYGPEQVREIAHVLNMVKRQSFEPVADPVRDATGDPIATTPDLGL